MDRRRLIAGLVVGLATAAAVAAYALWPRNVHDDVTFVILKGEHLQLRDLRGQVVLVNFWATTCPACVKEMPELVQTYRQYHGRGLEIIAVAMSYDPPAFVKKFAEKHGLPFPVALDTQEEIAKAFGGVKVVPTTFVLDKDGRLVSRTLGLIAFDRLRVFLDEQLGR
jgi:peroxiredoxin